jgi:hypothetical protein
MSFMSTAPRPQTSGPVRSLPVIEVTVDQQGRPAGVRASDPGNDARPARVGFQDDRFQADLGEQSGNVFGRLSFSWPGVIAPVAGVDPDQVAAQHRDLVRGGHGGASVVLGHQTIVALPRLTDDLPLVCAPDVPAPSRASPGTLTPRPTDTDLLS